MVHVDVRYVVGLHGITLGDGEKLYNLIHPALLLRQRVELDFEGVQACTAVFFNEAIGKLLADIPHKDVRELVHILDLNETGSKTVLRVVNNAEQYYRDATVRCAVDALVLEQSPLI